MHNRLLVCAAFGLLFSASACERKVPEDIVEKSLSRALMNAPNLSSAMCGVQVRGFSSVKSTIKQRGEKNTGVAHIVGTPWLGKDTPKSCEADVEYAYSYTSKSSRVGRKRRTNVTWSLESLKLVAVQTPGVTMKPVTEAPADDDGDDDKPAAKPAAK
jgi:hypothetical protein